MYYAANIPDIVVSVLKNQNNIFVMECKGGNGNRNKPYNEGRDQISRCMKSLNFDNGFLVFPQFTSYFGKHLGEINEIKKIENEDLQGLINEIQRVANQ
jgi:hypothetical protein